MDVTETSMSEHVSKTIRSILKRGHLIAGVSKGIFGLSFKDPASGEWHGFDVDLARAVAAAVLGDASAVEFVTVSPDERCRAVACGLVDVGTFNASATLGREAAHDVIFPQTMLHDGEALMVHQSELPVGKRKEGIAALSRRVVAVQQGATTESNLRRYFAECGLSYEMRRYASPQQALQAYAEGECNVYALDLIPLSGERLRLPQPEAHVILDEPISKEAMGPVVSAHDRQWVHAVTWIMRSVIEAEELGINSNNCHSAPAETMHHIRDFLHPSKTKLDQLGLQRSFPQLVLRQVGNYAEIFHKNLGCNSQLLLPRGRNALWSHGGLLISPSFQ
ncbi:hypothetical protein ATN79_05295 [Paraburkholderia caribensis]|nr:hypothetical protein ATN79_05295 [Paraburkholderia caribensis]